MTKLAIPDLNAGRIVRDWKAYFHKFMEVHGEPIKCDGRLLFGDGWGYSSTDYQGPEFPPPDDPKELRAIRLQYWTKQHAKLAAEQKALRDQIQTLTDWSATRSLPLQERRSYPIEEGSRVYKWGKPEDMDLSGRKSKLADLDHLVAEAREELEALE